VKFTAMRHRIDALLAALAPSGTTVRIEGGLPLEGPAPAPGMPLQTPKPSEGPEVPPAAGPRS
jgi:hypothetical protein